MRDTPEFNDLKPTDPHALDIAFYWGWRACVDELGLHNIERVRGLQDALRAQAGEGLRQETGE